MQISQTIEYLRCTLGGRADYFDLIAGTSTGGIIALGLGLGVTAQEMLDLYKVYARSTR